MRLKVLSASKEKVAPGKVEAQMRLKVLSASREKVAPGQVEAPEKVLLTLE